MSTSLQDMEEEGSSSCCGAKVYIGICADCKEHCDSVEEEADMGDMVNDNLNER